MELEKELGEWSKMELKNKVALVTGGGTGIGRATSVALAQRGATVVVNYSRSQADAEETVRRINDEGGRAKKWNQPMVLYRPIPFFYLFFTASRR